MSVHEVIEKSKSKMRIFVSEFVCSGAWPGRLDETSLLREGRAMLGAVATDFARIGGVEVTSTWDRRLGEVPVDSVSWELIESRDQESAAFRRLAAESDATFLISPELDRELAKRRRIIDEVDRVCIGPSAAAIDLCSNKLATYRFLANHRIPAVQTEFLAPNAGGRKFNFPIVAKPIDGAGSQDIQRISNVADLAEFFESHAFRNRTDRFVCQPLTMGQAVSVACLVLPESGSTFVFPIAAQHLSDQQRFTYLGGEIPVGLSADATDSIVRSVRSVCEKLPGVRGYMGFDFIVPDNSGVPLLVDINPRLTTSYLGYRELCSQNIAELLINRDSFAPSVTWNEGAIEFTSDGKVTVKVSK